MKTKKQNRTILVLRKDGQIKEVLDCVDKLDLSKEVEKYKVNDYVKEFYIKDLIKISILFLFSKEKYLKHFLIALEQNPLLCGHYNIKLVSNQQVYKSLKNRCWWFFYEAFQVLSKKLRNKETATYRLFRGKNVKIADSTFLEYCVSRLFFAKLGYSPTDSTYKEGIKIHTLLDYSQDQIEKFIETSANTHDSRVADNLLSDIKNCILLIDKGYSKLERFINFDKRNITFIIPFKSRLKHDVLESKTIHFDTGDVTLEKIELSNGMRVMKVTVLDFELITNKFSLQWFEVVGLYQLRWDIELLFKKLKQLWCINKPLFRNHNSIMTFICITLMAALILNELSKNFEIDKDTLYHSISRKISAYLIAIELNE